MNFLRSILVKLAINWGPLKDWWNKDLKGALLAIAGIIVFAFVVSMLFGCASYEYRPRIEAGLGYELDKDKPVMGRDPVGVVRLRQPLYVHDESGFELFGAYTHMSSVPDERDRNTVDQAELMFSLPLGKLESRCRP